MKRALYLTACFLFVSLVSCPAHAVTTEDIGTSCSTEAVGTSTMTSDGKNIVTCLKNDSGDQVWKGMTSGGGSGSITIANPIATQVWGSYCQSCGKNGCNPSNCYKAAYKCPANYFWISGLVSSCGMVMQEDTGLNASECSYSAIPFGDTASYLSVSGGKCGKF